MAGEVAIKNALILLMLVLWGNTVCAGPVQERNKSVARRVFDEIFNQSKFAVVPDLKVTVVQEVAKGDVVTELWTAAGTNTEGDGFPVTGKKMEARGITI
jgi:hypothetical protein